MGTWTLPFLSSVHDYNLLVYQTHDTSQYKQHGEMVILLQMFFQCMLLTEPSATSFKTFNMITIGCNVP